MISTAGRDYYGVGKAAAIGLVSALVLLMPDVAGQVAAAIVDILASFALAVGELFSTVVLQPLIEDLHDRFAESQTTARPESAP